MGRGQVRARQRLHFRPRAARDRPAAAAGQSATLSCLMLRFHRVNCCLSARSLKTMVAMQQSQIERVIQNLPNHSPLLRGTARTPGLVSVP